MRILVVNAGSSSVKLRVVTDGDDVDASADVERFDPLALDDLGPFDAVGHRVVHGGERWVEPVLFTDEVMADLRTLSALAPLHQDAALDAVEALARARPDLPQVGCFDTAFHAAMPPAATTYALPASWRSRWPLRRFGFHGHSHAWAVGHVRGQCDARRLVTCHLGAGASLAAVLDGRSIDTTMGFTPLEGLVMATRAGSVDPGLVLWLLQRTELDVDAVAVGLQRASGLAGVAGTADMRTVLVRADASDADARLALDLYVTSLTKHVAAMAASLGGLDALAFTGGVGEHAPTIRAAAADRLAWLGVVIDDVANESVVQGEITARGSTVRTFVVTAREDLEIARGVRRVLSDRPSRPRRRRAP